MVQEEIINIGISLREGNSKRIREEVLMALNQGVNHQDILKHMLGIMEEVGDKFKVNELFVPEVLIIGRAFNVALKIISPLLETEENGISIVIGTVMGDMHNIGKNLVKMLLTGTGASVIDLGVDVSPRDFVEAIRRYQPDVVAMSALLTTTMVQMSRTIQMLEKEGLRDQVKIMVGGAPVTKTYALNINADHYAKDAGEAAEYIRDLITQNSTKIDK